MQEGVKSNFFKTEFVSSSIVYTKFYSQKNIMCQSATNAEKMNIKIEVQHKRAM